MTEPVTKFFVVGWIDGSSIYVSCVSFEHAMNTYKEIIAHNPNAGRWFLDIMMGTMELVTTDKGKERMEFTSLESIKTAGTYDMFFEKAERDADKKIEEWMSGKSG